MRYSTLLVVLWQLLLGSASTARAQSAEQVVRGQLKWQGYAEAIGQTGQRRRVPIFGDGTFRAGEQIPNYQLRITGRVSQGEVRNAIYEPFSAADAKLFDAGKLPTAADVRLTTGTERRQPVTTALIQAVRRSAQTGQAEKLVSFDYAYSLSTDQPRTQARTYASNSVLNQGEWFKIGVATSGVYKLDKKALETLGLNMQGRDPRRLKIYGNAMGTLPQANSRYRPDDLAENAIFVAGENDNSFDDSDYVLFYARGPHTWSLDPSSATPRFQHELNVYADTAYYFVTVGTSAGRRVGAASTVAGTPTATVTQFLERQFHEHELLNLGKSGRQWVGEGFTNISNSREVAFNIPDMVPGAPLQVTSQVVGASVYGSTSRFQMTLNGTAVGQGQTVRGASSTPDWHPEIANSDLQTFTYQLPATPTADLRVRLTFSSPSDPAGSGYLDYLEINAPRRLRLTGNLLQFNSVRTNALSEFQLGAPGATVWDVTNPRQPRSIQLNNAGNFVALADSTREFLAFTGSDFPAPPRFFGRVATQNLHARLSGDVDMVIVTHPLFKTEADRLAAYRRTHDKLKVEVVTTTEVYNEFSSGGQDVTAIRDMMKMVYDRNSSTKLKYLLLFGDASYDFKSDATNDAKALPGWWSERSPQNGDKIAQNFVPTYESRESFALVYTRGSSSPQGKGVTFCSDDYFGLLDNDEGEWDENNSNELIDIGIGRLPVRTPRDQPRSTAQATLVVDKLIRYDQPISFGDWRNRVSFVADDGDGSIHISDSANPQADSLGARHPEYNVHKIYLDLYPQLIAAGGQRSPECNRAIDEALEQGSLLMHYSGHGGPDAWADERILTKESVLALQNQNRLTFMVTGTCDFGTYDNPEKDSGGELVLTDVKGGAIGLLTTTRLAFSHLSFNLSSQFYGYLFKPRTGQLPMLGDAIMVAKNNSVSASGNRNYVLLGDPTTRLSTGQQEVALDSINGRFLTAAYQDTLKALSTVRLSGVVQSGSAINTAFSGQAHVTVYEKPSATSTLKNEFDDVVLPITTQENIVYSGQATVRNGRFKLSFVVPKDINYSVGLGKIQLYAKDSVRVADARGYRHNPVGGPDNKAPLDTIAPVIRLFMDRESFVFGGLTGTNTMLISHLSDNSGINTAGSGIGHEITATLDNDPTKLTVLNDFYTADVDNYQAGKVRYLFKDLTTGPHVLHLKAWDTFNNSAQQEIEFIAANKDKLALQHVLNYPNPFSTKTSFQFDHNHTNDDLDVQVQIFTVSGRLVRTLRTTVVASAPHVGQNLESLTWNGRDEYEDQLARGVYVYRVNVRCQTHESTASKFEKLVILN